MSEVTLLAAIKQAIDEEMARDEDVFIWGEDVGQRGGVFLVTQGLQEKYGPERVLDTPLAESGIIGLAIGAALTGLKPIAEIQFADFIHPAFDQIVSEAARFCYRSNGEWTCPMVIRVPYGGGVGGGLYHSQCVEAFYAHVPGLKIVVPGTPYDAKGLLKAAVRDPNPVLYFEPKRLYRAVKGEVPTTDYSIPLGQADIKRPGADLTLVTYGSTLHMALQAADTVSAEGIDVEVLDLRTLIPLDKATIFDSVKKTSKVLIVHEDNLTGGFGGEIAALIADELFEYLDGPIRRLCSPDAPAVPFSSVLSKAFMLNADKIATAIRSLASY